MAVGHCKDHIACSEADIDHTGHVMATADRCKVTPHSHNRARIMQHPTGSRENGPPRQRMTSPHIFNCQNALSCVSEEQLKAVITALLLLLQHFVLRLHVENLTRDLTKTSAFTIQIQVMTGASDQYSDEGDFPTSPLHVQPAGKRQAIRSVIFGIHRKFCRASGGPVQAWISLSPCVCVLWHFRSLQTLRSLAALQGRKRCGSRWMSTSHPAPCILVWW